MAALTSEERDVLETLVDYNPRLVQGMQAVCVELTEQRAADTDDFLRTVVDGMNWEIEAFNGLREKFAELGLEFDKDEMNATIVRFNDAYKSKDDIAIAKSFIDDTIDVFILIEELARQALAA